MKSFWAFGLFSLIAIADAKCAIFNLETGVSRDGNWRVAVKYDGKFERARKGAKGFIVRSKGTIYAPGHHPAVYVSNSGRRFVIVDRYAGIAIYDEAGAIVELYEPKDLLSASELENRPGKWTCHPEGTCISGAKTERGAVVVSLTNGKTVRLEGV